MQDYLSYLLLILGLVLIVKGSDIFLDNALALAKKYNISPLILGTVLISLCTTFPEVFISGMSSLKGNPGLALGNALGSISCNTGLILGILIIFSKPGAEDRLMIKRYTKILLGLLVFLTIIGASYNSVPQAIGFLLLLILLPFFYLNLKRNSAKEETPAKEKANLTLKEVSLFFLSLVMIIWGADLVVDSAVIVAKKLKISDMAIGITLTAFGTSLPELATSITAIIKKSNSLSLGNILGANVLNILLVIGLAASINPIPITTAELSLHMPFVISLVAASALFTFFKQTSLARVNGFFLIFIYLVYIFTNILKTSA